MAVRKFWLVKSEPGAYSFDDLLKEEDQTAEWDGVRNYAARNTMRDDMQMGDGVLFYHSNSKPTAVVGYATVVRAGYPGQHRLGPRGGEPRSPKHARQPNLVYGRYTSGEQVPQSGNASTNQGPSRP